jgi:hypothetical protein
MTVPAAPPAGPARVSPDARPTPAAPDPRRAARFSALLGRSARAPASPGREPPATPLPHGRGRGGAPEERVARDAGDGAPGDGAPGAAPPLTPPGPVPGLPAAVGAARARAEAGVAAAAAAQLVESVQVGLDRAGQAEVRFDVADGPLKGLEVRLLAAAGGIDATFVAEDAATRRALAEPLQELQRTLAEQGITVARLEVAVRADVGGGHGSPRGHSAEAAPASVAAPLAGAASVAGSGAAAGLPLLRAGSPTDWIA